MSIEKAIVFAAIIIAFAIVIAPIVLQQFKVTQCVNTLGEVTGISGAIAKNACLQNLK